MVKEGGKGEREGFFLTKERREEGAWCFDCLKPPFSNVALPRRCGAFSVYFEVLCRRSFWTPCVGVGEFEEKKIAELFTSNQLYLVSLLPSSPASLLRFGWRQVRQEGRVPSTRSTSCSTNMHRQSGPHMCCLFFVAFPVLRPQALYQNLDHPTAQHRSQLNKPPHLTNVPVPYLVIVLYPPHPYIPFPPFPCSDS